MRKYFGTDGVRGVANTELSCSLAYRLGRAGGYVLTKGKEQVKVVVGRDTRISGHMLESALIAGLMSVGCDIITVGILPTPGVAYLTREYNADCGVVISASHNPYEYNGIKFFNCDGFKLDDEIELEIEKYIDEPGLIDKNPAGNGIGRKIYVADATKTYVEYIKSTINADFSGMKVVLDCANGAAYRVAPTVFKDLGAKVITMGVNPDGININEKCGSTHTECLQKEVLKTRADLGLAYDGDADRLIAVDENGQIIDGDKIMILGAIDMKKREKLKNNTLVVTVMSNIGLKIAAEKHGINIETTKVGDRYVLEEMRKSGYCLGGEQSGHLVFLDHNTTGDGTLSSVVLANIIRKSGKTASEMACVMEQYPQVLINVKVKNENKNAYMNYPEIKSEIENIENIMHGEGRVLIRPSGTEPLVRVMIEGKEEDQINILAKKLANMIEERLS